MLFFQKELIVQIRTFQILKFYSFINNCFNFYFIMITKEIIIHHLIVNIIIYLYIPNDLKNLLFVLNNF